MGAPLGVGPPEWVSQRLGGGANELVLVVKRLGGRRRWSEGPIDTHPAPYTPHSVHACRLAVYVQIKDKEKYPLAVYLHAGK